MLLMHHGTTGMDHHTLLPQQAADLLARLDTHPEMIERRQRPRWEYRVQGELRLAGDDPSSPRWMVFTRDISPWAAGFITPHVLPVYRSAILRIPSPGDQVLHIRCQIRRCRQIAPGWYHAAVDFDREEIIFLV